MSKYLTTVLFGTFMPPEKCTTRTHRCMTGSQQDKGMDKIIQDAEIATIRLLRDYRKSWFTSTEICKEAKITLAAKAYKPILFAMVAEGFILERHDVRANGSKRRLFAFNGVVK